MVPFTLFLISRPKTGWTSGMQSLTELIRLPITHRNRKQRQQRPSRSSPMARNVKSQCAERRLTGHSAAVLYPRRTPMPAGHRKNVLLRQWAWRTPEERSTPLHKLSISAARSTRGLRRSTRGSTWPAIAVNMMHSSVRKLARGRSSAQPSTSNNCDHCPALACWIRDASFGLHARLGIVCHLRNTMRAFGSYMKVFART